MQVFHGVRRSQPPRPRVMHEVSAREGSREAFTGETTGWVSSCETGRIPRCRSRDVLLASGSTSVAALQQVARSVAILFVNVIDPVGAGFVRSLARPGGNTTGFVAFEYNISGKWLELLKKVAPQTTRIAVLRDPAIASGIGQFAVIQSAASWPGIDLSVIDLAMPMKLNVRWRRSAASQMAVSL